MDPWALLERIATDYRPILGVNLVGVYVHGSLAFGCFHPGHSDIDFLVVVERALSLDEKQALLRILFDAEDQAPTKGLEMSVVRAAVCRPFVIPRPLSCTIRAPTGPPAAPIWPPIVRTCRVSIPTWRPT